MALVAYGGDAVNWYEIDEEETFPIKGITAVVISWVFSPLASGIVSVVFFLIARTFILRAANSYDRSFVFLPALVFICIFINAFYVLDKGINKQCVPRVFAGVEVITLAPLKCCYYTAGGRVWLEGVQLAGPCRSYHDLGCNPDGVEMAPSL